MKLPNLSLNLHVNALIIQNSAKNYTILYQINENCIVFIADGKGGHRDPPLRFRV